MRARPPFDGFCSVVFAKLTLGCWLGVACAGSPFSAGSSGGAPQGGGESGAAAQADGGATMGGRSGSGGSAAGGSHAGGEESNGGAGNNTVGGAGAISKDGLLLWLSAERGVTTVSGAVSKWQDQSNNHADATQVLTVARPRVVSAGSLSMIEFDGVDDALALPEGFDDFRKGLSFFAVLEPLDDGGCSSVMQLSNGAEIDDIDFGRQQRSIHYEVVEASFTGTPDALPSGERKMVEYFHATSGEVELRIDGQYVTSETVALPTKLSRAANFVARTLYQDCTPLNARIGEMILYGRALANAERVQVETYLREKWSVDGPKP